MNVALIIAGGSGQRMQQDIPKQFLHIHDKPVIIYTLEGFQRNPQIDAIEVVCLDGWHEVLWANAKQFGIYKLKWVISGGSTAQESIRNGIENLSDVCGALSHESHASRATPIESPMPRAFAAVPHAL